MKEILYLEVPTPEDGTVRTWLREAFQPVEGEKVVTPDGFRLILGDATDGELSVFAWSVQRTTYIKVFRWADGRLPHERRVVQQLVTELRSRFPYHYPELPTISGDRDTIFQELAPYYPQTVKYFQKMPRGAYDLARAYWWEKRWRDSVRQPHPPAGSMPSRQAIVDRRGQVDADTGTPAYDLIYVGGALGVIHAAVMARLGYKVLLLERLTFGRMNREWNISRDEFQRLIDLGLFTQAEFEASIAREYKDGFHKFFDANNPPQCKAPVLHTPKVLNVALDSEIFLRLCGDKLRAAGGDIWDETEFQQAEVGDRAVTVRARHLPTGAERRVTGRVLVDAMGTASPIAWQLNGGRTFDSVCPTVGAIASGFAPEVWDGNYGDVLNSHGDISRGRQLIWELFPGVGGDRTIYLFHYHQVHPDNPGSLLDMYEDFFTILPEYRRCDMDTLEWKKPTFGYIPGHFSTTDRDRRVAIDRLVAIGDAASLQSPLIFTGFGSLIRNLERLTVLLDTALKHDLLTAHYLNRIRAYQSNVSVTWLFSKGMMVPTGKHLPPERVNAMLNTFFGILASESTEVADGFIKDRVDWFTFTRLALKAAWLNPALLWWIWQLAGTGDLVRWLWSYFTFSLHALISGLLGWLPGTLRWLQPWLEPRYPGLWLWLLTTSYNLTSGMGRPSPTCFGSQRVSVASS